MSKRNLQRKLNTSVEIISYNPKSTVFKLDQRQGGGRKYEIRIPVSPKENSLLEEIINSMKQKKDVRFKGIYEEKPTSYFTYLMVGLNLLFFIRPKNTLEVFKKYKYEGEISVPINTKRRIYYNIKIAAEDRYFPGYPTFNIEKASKINATLLK